VPGLGDVERGARRMFLDHWPSVLEHRIGLLLEHASVIVRHAHSRHSNFHCSRPSSAEPAAMHVRRSRRQRSEERRAAGAAGAQRASAAVGACAGNAPGTPSSR